MRSPRRVLMTAVLLLSAGLQPQPVLPAGAWRIAEAPPHLRDQIARADLIILRMQDTLQRELRDELAQGGPAFAVQSCHIDVAGITQRLSRQEGVAAGRTSDRLRNPANAPRAWAVPLLAAGAGRPAREIDGFAVDLGDAVGVLRPIAHREVCNGCHGTTDRIDPATQAAIRQRYPADRATGFREGDIRGWFWVEVPRKLRD